MFVKLSTDKILNQKIILEGAFITDYMPYAPEMCIKVYLSGLALATGGADNSEDMIAQNLGITADDVLSAFKYWEDQGLVTMLSITPPLVEYNEIVPAEKRIKTFSKAKYKAFNDQLHAMLPGRSFLPAEYHEYYSAVENLHIEPEGLLAIIAYCVRLKGESIGYPYILTVTRNLAAEGYTTFERINERLSEFDLYDGEIRAIIKALKLKRQPDVSDKRFYIKWTRTLGFTPETIIKVAKDVKKGGIEKLDTLLVRYFENRALSYAEIQNYNQTRDKLFSLTATITRVLCKYYERLDYIVETYTQKWLGFGFTDDALVALADYCFKHNSRDLESMDRVVMEFYEKGLLDCASIEGFKAEAAGADAVIASILKAGRIERNITSWDRDYYRTWTYSWELPLDLIKYSAELSGGKGMPYINAILANWQSKGIKNIEDAKKLGAPSPTAAATPNVTTVTNKSAEELRKGLNMVSAEDI